MRGLFVGIKFVGWLVICAVLAPLAWVFRTHDNFEGEVFSDYDDDDPGEDVD